MLAGRKVLKRITEELVANPSWKIIVLGNNWLCPYCGEIGARELSMSERIEDKIARHLVEACASWNNFGGAPLSAEELRRKAKLVVFKRRIARWVLDDRRYSMATDDGRWLCPMCGDLSDIQLPIGDPRSSETYGIHLEESPFLSAVSRHLLSCKNFERGLVKSQPELDAIKARRDRQARFDEVRSRFEREPEWQLVDQSRRWLCPFCATPSSVVFPKSGADDAFFRGLGEHLLVCRSYRALRGKPRPVEYLTEQVARMGREQRLEQLRRKIQERDLWRCRDLERRWYCPYCAEATDVRYPDIGSAAPGALDDFTELVLEHLRRCRSYRKDKAGIRTRDDMLTVLKAANLRIKRHKELCAVFESSPLFGVFAEDRSWVCPYCVRALEEVEAPELWPTLEGEPFEQFADAVLAHFAKGCGPASGNQGPQTTLAKLQSIAARRRGELSNSFLGVTAVSNEWARLKQEIEQHQSREQSAEQTHEATLESVRRSRRRMLPKLPLVPGFEFAAEQRVSESIGGDFYDFFKVDDERWGLAIGGFAGQGIDAALTGSLTKKLLQIHGRREGSCKAALAKVNEDIYEDLSDESSVGIFLGYLDPATRTFHFSCAGFSAPLLVYNERRQPKLSVVETSGDAIGVSNDPSYQDSLQERKLQLVSGDVLVQTSAGNLESLNLSQEHFGIERLALLVERYGRFESEYLLWKLRKALEQWSPKAPNSEDQTTIAFRVL